MYYEILFKENGIYYISYYINKEDKPTGLRIDEKSFNAWKVGKIER